MQASLAISLERQASRMIENIVGCGDIGVHSPEEFPEIPDGINGIYPPCKKKQVITLPERQFGEITPIMIYLDMINVLNDLMLIA